MANTIETTEPAKASGKAPLAMPNQELHNNAVKLLLARTATGTETAAKAATKKLKPTIKSYNQRRREATEKLRPILKEIWACFDRGESVGGFTGKEAWAAGQSITIRQIQRIIAGSKQATSCRLRGGLVVTVAGRQFRLREVDVESITTTGKKTTTTVITMTADEVLDTPKSSKLAPTKIKKLTATETKDHIQRVYQQLNDERKDDHSREWAAEYGKRFEAAVGENCTKWNATQVRVERDRIESMLGARLKATQPKLKPKATHACKADGRARCNMRLGQAVLTVAPGETPICRLGLVGLDADKRAADYEGFLRTFPEGTSKKKIKRLWNEWVSGSNTDPVSEPANALAAAIDAAPTAPITVNPTKAQAAPVPQAPRLAQSPLTPGKKYTVRVAASGGYGIFEPLSPFCIQKHLTRDAAWAAIDAVIAVPPCQYADADLERRKSGSGLISKTGDKYGKGNKAKGNIQGMEGPAERGHDHRDDVESLLAR